MRYAMREKLFSLRDRYCIKNEQGLETFIVEGELFSIADRLSFQDMTGHELAVIRQKLLSLGKTYEIYRGDELTATVKKSMFSLFHAHFSVDVPGPGDLEADGNFLDYEYAFTRNGQPVARVSKELFALADTYGIDIPDNEDEVLILACAVVIDLASHEDN